MSEFLKDYLLFGDMCRLNNEAYFAEGFDVPDINEFLAALTDAPLMRLNGKTLKIYLLNLVRGKEKSVFVELKWLLCLHRTLHSLTNPALLEKVYDSLSRMELPETANKVQEFVRDGIVRPYIHFLAKNCLIRLQQMERSTDNLEDKQNQHPQRSLAFVRYNLIKYSVAELLPTVLQLEPFFGIYYPVLAKIPIHLHRTLTDLIHSARKGFKEERLPIEEQELLTLEGQIEELDHNNSDPSYLDAKPTEIGSKLSLFMESGHKVQQNEDEQWHPRTSQF